MHQNKISGENEMIKHNSYFLIVLESSWLFSCKYIHSIFLFEYHSLLKVLHLTDEYINTFLVYFKYAFCQIIIIFQIHVQLFHLYGAYKGYMGVNVHCESHIIY